MVEAKTSVQLSPREYVSHIVALPQYVVAGLTDSSILQLPLTLDADALTTIQPGAPPSAKNQATTTGLASLPATPMAIVTCDSQGHLKTWDLRMRGAQQQTNALDSKLTVTAMGVSNFGEVALGTAAQPDAEIYVYDVRQIKASKPLVRYRESHNDDVTDLQFHPSVRNLMLSGSTDGVVNLFDTSITDEDEAVIEAYNNISSIHRTGFFTDTLTGVLNLNLKNEPASIQNNRVFALSHMETLKVFPVGNDDKSVNEDYGDLREKWSCQYVADYSKNHFMIGSNDEGWAGLVPMHFGAPQPLIKLDNGHGNEVVRCFDISQASGACYTGGEDGNVKLWDIGGHFDTTAKLASEVGGNGALRPGKSKKKTLKDRKNETKKK